MQTTDQQQIIDELLVALADILPGAVGYMNTIDNEQYRAMWSNQIQKARALCGQYIKE